MQAFIDKRTDQCGQTPILNHSNGGPELEREIEKAAIADYLDHVSKPGSDPAASVQAFIDKRTDQREKETEASLKWEIAKEIAMEMNMKAQATDDDSCRMEAEALASGNASVRTTASSHERFLQGLNDMQGDIEGAIEEGQLLCAPQEDIYEIPSATQPMEEEEFQAAFQAAFGIPKRREDNLKRQCVPTPMRPIAAEPLSQSEINAWQQNAITGLDQQQTPQEDICPIPTETPTETVVVPRFTPRMTIYNNLNPNLNPFTITPRGGPVDYFRTRLENSRGGSTQRARDIERARTGDCPPGSIEAMRAATCETIRTRNPQQNAQP